MDQFCYILCFAFVMLSCLFIAALWSLDGKGLASWLSGMFYCVFVTFPCGVLGLVWYLIVLIPDLSLLALTIIQCNYMVIVRREKLNMLHINTNCKYKSVHTRSLVSWLVCIKRRIIYPRGSLASNSARVSRCGLKKDYAALQK